MEDVYLFDLALDSENVLESAEFQVCPRCFGVGKVPKEDDHQNDSSSLDFPDNVDPPPAQEAEPLQAATSSTCCKVRGVNTSENIDRKVFLECVVEHVRQGGNPDQKDWKDILAIYKRRVPETTLSPKQLCQKMRNLKNPKTKTEEKRRRILEIEARLLEARKEYEAEMAERQRTIGPLVEELNKIMAKVRTLRENPNFAEQNRHHLDGVIDLLDAVRQSERVECCDDDDDEEFQSVMLMICMEEGMEVPRAGDVVGVVASSGRGLMVVPSTYRRRDDATFICWAMAGSCIGRKHVVMDMRWSEDVASAQVFYMGECIVDECGEMKRGEMVEKEEQVVGMALSDADNGAGEMFCWMSSASSGQMVDLRGLVDIARKARVVAADTSE